MTGKTRSRPEAPEPDMRDPFAPCDDPHGIDCQALAEERLFTPDGIILWRKRVFLPENARQQVDEFDAEFEPSTSEHRKAWLNRMALDERGGWRELLVADASHLRAIEDLAAHAGHARQLFDLLLSALRASQHLLRPLALPPILLVSPPGLGKTFLATEIAARLRTASQVISIPNQTSTAIFCGLDSSWRAARPGEIAKALIQGESAQPLLILDEIDKATRAGDYGFILHPLHDLWEPRSAGRMEDDFLKERFAADRILWIATANRINALMPSILDRTIVIELPGPTESQFDAIFRSIYRHLCGAYGTWFSEDLPAEIIRAISTRAPRQVRKILMLALTRAASEQRRVLDIADINFAAGFVAGPQKVRMGFV